MPVSPHPPKNGFVAVARKIYNPIGFAKGYNFVLWFIFLGALFGFTLSRFQSLDLYGTFCSQDDHGPNNKAAPGECFYWLQPPYTAGIILHLAGILPAALLACLQFVPVVRHKAIMVHRVNGYVVMVLSLAGTAGAFIIARRSFGGGLDVQTAVGALGIAFVGALVLSYINIRRLQIEQHRAWMLRAWVWAGCIITNRIILSIAALVPKSDMAYYSIPCDKLSWMLGGQNETLSLYPACLSFFTGETLSQHAAVRASLPDATNVAEAAAALDSTFGMALWLAFIIHVAGIELYLHLTPAETERLRKVSYERQLKAGMKHPGSAGLTADRLGDAEQWTLYKTRAEASCEGLLRPDSVDSRN
ncbi:hypothetical protein F4775DRAFT_599554 [Biscogniauxia sp. FL1348]|nr:hypothetical protein F4775DRAFT_599554 [Biscogniauxia sp. FL1348]